MVDHVACVWQGHSRVFVDQHGVPLVMPTQCLPRGLQHVNVEQDFQVPTESVVPRVYQELSRIT
jgi:hypothetical protein